MVFWPYVANSGFMEGAAQVGDGGWVMTTKKSRLGVTSSRYCTLRLETFFFQNNFLCRKK